MTNYYIPNEKDEDKDDFETGVQVGKSEAEEDNKSADDSDK